MIKRMNAYRSRLDTALASLAGGDSIKAEALFRAILAEAPDCAEAWHGLACVARHTGQPRLAIASVAHALTLTQDNVERARFHLTLAASLDEAGHLREAVSACRVATLMEPRDFRAHALMSELLYRSEQNEAAASAFSMALSLAADPVPLLTRHGAFLMEQRRFAAAMACFRRLVALCPQEAAAHANLGAACFENGAMEEALAALRKAVALAPPSAQTLNNLGLVYQALGYSIPAEEAFDAALALFPDDCVLACNRATLLAETDREKEAETFFRDMIADGGAWSAQARFNLGMIQLGRGEFAQGWSNFESRQSLIESTVLPPWDGERTEGRVLIEGEQGLGDCLQFLRFVPDAALRAPLLLRLPEVLDPLLAFMPELQPLLRSGRVVLSGEATKRCSLLSLPARLGVTTVDASPYLDFGLSPEKGRIGIFNAGNPTYRFDARRSLPRAYFAPILAVQGVTFVNLQQEQDAALLEPGVEQGIGHTLVDTARALARCEMVIGVDTMMAHLTGAMGRPLWLLDREGGDWRWKGPDWYTGLRIFRPEGGLPPDEAWPPVIERVAQALRERSGGYDGV
ncbi:tetratricopeptide repeat protein [Asaia sp. W19]|nr:tetratricopeptide repeat protein [Asaia sp. W19]